MQGFECACDRGSTQEGYVQAPRPAEDHRFQELGAHECGKGGLSEDEGRKEDDGVSVVLFFGKR